MSHTQSETAGLAALALKDIVRIKTTPRILAWIFQVGRLYKSFRILVILTVGLIVVRRLMYGQFSQWDFAIVAMVGLPLMTLFVLPRVVTMQEHEIKERFFALQFDEALAVIPAFIQIGLPFRKGWEVALTATSFRVRYLAMTGHKGESLVITEALAKTFPEIPAAEVAELKARLYRDANDFEQSLVWLKKHAELAPGEAKIWLEMLEVYATYLNQPAEARRCLEHASSLATAPPEDAIKVSEAIVMLAEGEYIATRTILEGSLPKFEEMATVISSGATLKAIVLAYLTIACAKSGDLETARKYFADAESVLEAGYMGPLLEQCRRALGSAEIQGGV